MDIDTDPGQVAFEAYSQATGGLTHDGQDIPPWDDLSEHIRTAWRAAAQASVRQAQQSLNATEED
jgi:hypothetical protein